MNDIIKRPVVTERMTEAGEKLNQYGFIVDKRADKGQIRKSIEELYKVKVTSVRTMNYMGKKSSRFTKSGLLSGSKAAFKKAVVTVAKGDAIDLYAGI